MEAEFILFSLLILPERFIRCRSIGEDESDLGDTGNDVGTCSNLGLSNSPIN